jgi:hypothetical protein
VYQFVNGGYYFSLQANKDDANFNLIRLGCNTQRLEISQGQTYKLKEQIDGNAYGKYFFNTSFTYTSEIHQGEMAITKLDFENNIVSGTFWYDIEDKNGIVHKVREGRFDMRFTQ